MSEIRGDARLLDCLGKLLASTREELLIAFAHRALTGEWLLVVEDCRLADDTEVSRDVHGLHWSGDLTSTMYGEASRSGRGVVLLHAHPGAGSPPRLSPTDSNTVDEILSHFGALLPDVAHAYAVVNSTNSSGWMQLGEERRRVGSIRIATSPRREWPAAVHPPLPPRPRDKRQVGALGARGVEELRRSSVGVVGLGGAGSQVAEMLAHAGVGRLLLADADRIEDVNLSRTHGTTPESLGVDKVVSAAEMVRRIAPETEVCSWTEAFPAASLLGSLRDVDVMVGCVDNVHTRNELNRFALRYAIPLIDLGTTITEDPFRIDGHLSVVLPGDRCLRCMGHVSDALLEEARDRARRGDYGLSDGRPQVVSFNGLLASAAVTEVLKLVTGFAGEGRGAREFHYDPVAGELRGIGLASGRCRECHWYALKADDA